jgi:hypothetical protein
MYSPPLLSVLINLPVSPPKNPFPTACMPLFTYLERHPLSLDKVFCGFVNPRSSWDPLPEFTISADLKVKTRDDKTTYRKLQSGEMSISQPPWCSGLFVKKEKANQRVWSSDEKERMIAEVQEVSQRNNSNPPHFCDPG